jgi:hypothetical protein
MIQRRRQPAIAVLLAGVLAAAVYLPWTARAGQAGSSTSIEQLERAIARPDAGPDIWLQYAQRLNATGRFLHAEMAYRQVLQRQANHKQAQFELACLLAKAGKTEEFYAAMRDMVVSEAKLAVDVFGRPECQQYLDAPRFIALVNEAKTQAMD